MKSKNWRGPKHNSSARAGMTVLEVLVAFSVIALVALASATFYNQQRNLLSNFTPNSECKAVLEGEMNYIRQQGMASTGLPWKDLSTPFVNPLDTGIDFSDPWLMAPGTIPINNMRFSSILLSRPVVKVSPTGGNEVEIANFTLQRGAMGLLNALYNNRPGIESTDYPVSSLGAVSVMAPTYDDKSLFSFVSTIRIEPFKLSNRAVVTPMPQPFWIRPQGLTDSAPGIFQFAPDVHRDYGYRVTLKGEYQDRSPKPAGVPPPLKTCSISEDFTYPIDKAAQSISVIWSTTDNAARGSLASVRGPLASVLGPPYISVATGEAPGPGDPPIGRPECSHTPGLPLDMTMTIGFDTGTATPIETGTVFMCRDMSEQLNPNYCAGPPGGDAVGAVMRGKNYNIGGTDPAALKWKPCSEVTACGIAPSKVFSWNDPVKPGSLTYQLQYKNDGTSTDGLWGCDIRMDVASVDLAGNFQLLSSMATPNPLLKSTDARRYFQPVNCYSCYKKKKKNWGVFIIATIITGGAFLAVDVVALAAAAISCVAGTGGLCKGGGAGTLKGFACSNNPGSVGADFCRRSTAPRPLWSPDPTPTCQARSFTIPAAYGGGSIALPTTPSGGMANQTIARQNMADYCTVQGLCDNGTWNQVPDDSGGYTPFLECGDVLTRYKLSIAGLPAGAPAPTAGTPTCTVTMQDTVSWSPFDYPAMFGGMKVCSPAVTGLSQNVLCSPPPFPTVPPTYPTDGTGGDNVDPNKYYYLKKTAPVLPLPSCI